MSNVEYAILLGVAFLAIPSAARAEEVVLRGARVHTVSGETLSRGDVRIRDGKIAAVGAALDAQGAVVVDCTGLQLYPGIIAATTSIGLAEIGAVRSTQDTNEVGEYAPDVQAWIAVNPDSELIPVARANGITHALTLPMGGIVAGQSGLVAFAGWTTEQMTVRAPVGLHVFWPGQGLDTTPKEKWKSKKQEWKPLEKQAEERRAKIKEVDDFFEGARAYARAREAGAAGTGGISDDRVRPSWEAMLPAVRGEIPLFVHADEVRQIRSALAWAKSRGWKIVLAGGRDAWMVAETLAAEKVPVIFERVMEQPARDIDPYDVHFRAPETLRKAGVRVIFSHGAGAWEAAHMRDLPYEAAMAVAFGYPADEALKGITLYPAQLLGAGDRLGSIEPGKEATLIATDGDLFDIRANVRRMWIAGKETDLASRHTRLYEKYRNRPR